MPRKKGRSRGEGSSGQSKAKSNKPKTSPGKNSSPNNLSRRGFLQTAALGGLGALLIGRNCAGPNNSAKDTYTSTPEPTQVIPTTTSSELSFGEWYRANLRNHEGIPFVHPKFCKLQELSELEKTSYDKFVLQQIPEGRVINRQGFSGKHFDESNINISLLKKCEVRSKEEVEKFFSYCGISKSLEGIIFERLTSTTNIPDQDNILPSVYIVSDIGTTPKGAIYSVEVNAGVYEIALAAPSWIGGTSDIEIQVKGEGPKKHIEWKYSPMVIALGKNPTKFCEALFGEFLHYALSQDRVQRIKEGLANITLRAVYQEAAQWIRIEEGLVHAITKEYIDSHTKELGLQEPTTVLEGSKYELVNPFSKVLEKKSSTELVNAYKTNTLSVLSLIQER